VYDYQVTLATEATAATAACCAPVLNATAAVTGDCSACSRQRAVRSCMFRCKPRGCFGDPYCVQYLNLATMPHCVTQHAHVLMQMSALAGHIHHAVNKATQQLCPCLKPPAVSAALADCWQLPLPQDQFGAGRCTGASSCLAPCFPGLC
jgi:hypothetical protein